MSVSLSLCLYEYVYLSMSVSLSLWAFLSLYECVFLSMSVDPIQSTSSWDWVSRYSLSLSMCVSICLCVWFQVSQHLHGTESQEENKKWGAVYIYYAYFYVWIYVCICILNTEHGMWNPKKKNLPRVKLTIRGNPDLCAFMYICIWIYIHICCMYVCIVYMCVYWTLAALMVALTCDFFFWLDSGCFPQYIGHQCRLRTKSGRYIYTLECVFVSACWLDFLFLVSCAS